MSSPTVMTTPATDWAAFVNSATAKGKKGIFHSKSIAA